MRIIFRLSKYLSLYVYVHYDSRTENTIFYIKCKSIKETIIEWLFYSNEWNIYSYNNGYILKKQHLKQKQLWVKHKVNANNKEHKEWKKYLINWEEITAKEYSIKNKMSLSQSYKRLNNAIIPTK